MIKRFWILPAALIGIWLFLYMLLPYAVDLMWFLSGLILKVIK